MLNFKDKKILITGGSGYLSDKIIQRLIALGSQIRIVARNEGKLVEVKEKYPEVEIIIGDIADSFICDKICLGMDGIIHTAAVKHVGLAETNVRQTIQTNIPLALLESTRKYKPKFIIGISTDKAASRKGVYGATKYLMERLFNEYEELNPDTKYRIVRYGNVLYSSGSVLVKWKERILNGDIVTITDPKATRFFWTVDQAVDLIFECLEKAIDSTPYVTEMKSMEMGELLAAMTEKYAGVKDYPINVIGLQSGENMHEIIIEGGPNSSEVEQFTKKEIMKVI